MRTTNEMVEAFRFLLDVEKRFAYGTTYELRGLNLRKKEATWLLIVKAYNRSKDPVVAFIEAETLYGCLNYLDLHCTTTRAPLSFKPDKWG